MRVSKLSCLNGPEPEPTKLLRTVAFAGRPGSAPRMAPAAGEILSIGIMLLLNAVRVPPVPTPGVPVAGSKNTPPPATPAGRDTLKTQKPGGVPVVCLAQLRER